MRDFSILKSKLLNVLWFVLGGYEKTTCHSKNLVEEAEVKLFFGKGIMYVACVFEVSKY